MPNTFALTLKAQNSYPASSVVQAATQQIPDLSFSENDLISGVFEAYGSGQVNTLTMSGTTINSVLNGGSAVALTNPITNATLVLNNFRGLYVTVTQRDPLVAPASTITTPIAATLALTPSTGSKVFVVTASLAALVVNMRVRITSTTFPNEYVEGIATVYSGTNLTVVVDSFQAATQAPTGQSLESFALKSVLLILEASPLQPFRCARTQLLRSLLLPPSRLQQGMY